MKLPLVGVNKVLMNRTIQDENKNRKLLDTAYKEQS